MKEDPIEFSVPCLPVQQPIGEFYLASIPAKQLLEITYFDVRRVLVQDRDVEKYLGIQRPLVPKRVDEIATYVRTSDACFPTGVIIAVPERCVELDESRRTMTIRNRPAGGDEDDPVLYRNIARVLDGQHRLAGLEGFDGQFDINVSVFVDADISDQAMVFSTVNLAQTKVNKSLVYDLFDVMRHRSPQKVAHNTAVLLDKDEGSPFYRMIKRLGVATYGRDKHEETLTQATVVQPIVDLISANPVTDRDTYLRNSKPSYLEGGELIRHPLQHLFVDERDYEIVDVIWNLFAAVSARWPDAWNTRDRGYMLNRTNGYRALLGFLKLLYRSRFNPGTVPTQDEFAEILSRVKMKDDDFNTHQFPAGSSGESALKGVLVESIT